MTGPVGRAARSAAPGDTAPADADFDRFVREAAEAAFDRVLGNVPPPEEVLPQLEPADLVRWAGDRFTELLAAFAELPLDRLVSRDDPYHDTGRADRSGESGDAAAGDPLVLRAGAGELAEARIWIHVIGDLPLGELRFALTDLLSDLGDSLPGRAADFEPAELAVPTPLGASTVLRYPVPPGAAAGRYQGVVVGRGVAGAAVAVTVVVG